MVDSALRLKDKTYIITGPFSTVSQSITSTLTEHGADVAVIGSHSPTGERYCRNIMDQREVNDKFGRAIYITAETHSLESAENNLSKAAEAFGSVDGLIDTHLFYLPSLYNCELQEIESQEWLQAIKLMQFTTKAYLKFIQGRKKGNSVVLYHQFDKNKFSNLSQKFIIEDYILELCSQVADYQTSINSLSVGCSEEYLLNRVSNGSTIQNAITTIQNDHPKAKIIDNQQIANAVCFLSSPLCLGLSGQNIYLNHGTIFPT